MSPDDLRQEVELKVVEMIKARLADGSMTEERAQQISKLVLDTLQPNMSFKQLYKAIPKLDDTNPELSGIIQPVLKDYEDNVNKKALTKVSEYIQIGQYDAAVKLAEKAINQDIDLVWQASAKSS